MQKCVFLYLSIEVTALFSAAFNSRTTHFTVHYLKALDLCCSSSGSIKPTHHVSCHTIETVAHYLCVFHFSYCIFQWERNTYETLFPLYLSDQGTTLCFIVQKHSVRRAALMETDPCSVEAVWKDSNPPAGWDL